MTDSSAAKESDVHSQSPATAALPAARIVRTRGSFGFVAIFAVAVILGVGVYVGFRWWDGRGAQITIEFARSHALERGAPLTLNGVCVGEVEAVGLRENQAVAVRVRLTADDRINAMIARAGSQFWVPSFSADLATGVRNVAAAFSPRIAVLAGAGRPQHRFVGLEREPPNVWWGDGDLAVVLRAVRNRGVTAGSAVLYRGLPIGEIVRTQLSRDSTKFEAWLRIFARYRSLVRKNSRFVDSSGVNVELGFTGVSVDLPSLRGMLAGSVQLFTPTEAGPPAEAGREFELELTAAESYFEWHPYIEFAGYEALFERERGPIPRPTQATLSYTYRRGWGWMSDGSATHAGLALVLERGVLLPRNLVRPDEDHRADLHLRVGAEVVDVGDERLAWMNESLALVENDVALAVGWRVQRVRAPGEPESVTVFGPSGARHLLDREYVEADDGVWGITQRRVFDVGWHGAAVLATRDERLIGLLLVDDDGEAVVAPIPADATLLQSTATAPLN